MRGARSGRGARCPGCLEEQRDARPATEAPTPSFPASLHHLSLSLPLSLPLSLSLSLSLSLFFSLSLSLSLPLSLSPEHVRRHRGRADADVRRAVARHVVEQAVAQPRGKRAALAILVCALRRRAPARHEPRRVGRSGDLCSCGSGGSAWRRVALRRVRQMQTGPARVAPQRPSASTPFSPLSPPPTYSPSAVAIWIVAI